MSFISFFILGACITTSLAMCWFNSTLPLHVFWRLKKFGFMRDSGMWHNIPEWESTWNDWADQFTLFGSPFFSSLLTCRVCLSVHLSIWVGLFLFLVFCPITWANAGMCFATSLGWPIIVNILLKATK